jgi:hypothetical protein
MKQEQMPVASAITVYGGDMKVIRIHVFGGAQ